MLKWSDSYSVCVKELDSQHKQIFFLFNKVHKELTINSSAYDPELTLVELVNYLIFHLQFEKSFFRLTRSAGREQHRDYDEHLRRKVIKIHNYYYRQGGNYPVKILSFLDRWMTNHIIEGKESHTRLIHDRTLAPDSAYRQKLAV
jgi:hemerythrin